MVLYTPLSMEEIYPEEENHYQLINYQGKSVYVTKNETGELQLMRLMSTDPQDFLNNSFTPGTMLINEFVQQMK